LGDVKKVCLGFTTIWSSIVLVKLDEVLEFCFDKVKLRLSVHVVLSAEIGALRLKLVRVLLGKALLAGYLYPLLN